MLEKIKTYKINNVEYEVYKFSFNETETYCVFVTTRRSVHVRRFTTKEKALEYILNKVSKG